MQYSPFSLKSCLKHHLLVLLCLASLGGCATAHLHPEEPMSLLAVREYQRPDRDNALSRTAMSTLLSLDKKQRAHFDRLLDSFKHQHLRLKPKVKQFQNQVRTAFLSSAFNARQLEQDWLRLAGPTETALLKEGSVKLYVFWQSLSPQQQKKLSEHLYSLQSRFDTGTESAVAKMRPKQEQRLKQIIQRARLNGQQQQFARALLVNSQTAKVWQSQLQKEMELLLKSLNQNEVNAALIQQKLGPFYQNARLLAVQLKALEKLHQSLQAQQRKALIDSFLLKTR